MTTPGKPTKKETKRQTPAKTSFNSPFTPTWRPIPQEDMHFILKTLKDKLLFLGLEKKEVKVFRPWRKKKEQPPAAVVSEPVCQVQDSPKNGWTDVAARRQLAIGINEVTKALERNELKLVLVCKSVKPKHMTNHLIALSATRGVPACQVPRLSQSVSGPLGLKSVLALGFRRCASKDEEVFTDTVDAIKPKVPSLDVEWLHDVAATLTPEEHADKEENKMEEAGEKRGEKRKLEAEAEEVTESLCTLQPLKVKKIVANPAKKRQKKMKS
ncbi:ribonuclease P protein subunit p38 [Anabas testudineus]|uniref:Ribosomal protein eL8/eL30/eS12/Gadd45 domain-containing protein n=1 Tax=Anabas testudineus TaxID=64144 RepID=A0AAQ6IR61_ANATE|nr:ribonuclease P protein subunit p38 [Anabas testudineus]XP_026228588.1 ribonuclease P protein subunit p38 [Anabas testudineus]XP_026228589.1 ribonuclease P protein subunit p38 [Anabas testudineus]XP_026228590.1 ribonuclease P protein subunit p38 [Anabas testudineus]XP_033182284.1 ribonuclease P protein subunit p38 [Anabas testudineus]